MTQIFADRFGPDTLHYYLIKIKIADPSLFTPELQTLLCRDVGLEFRELKDCFSLFHLLRDGHIRFYVAIFRAQILLRD